MKGTPNKKLSESSQIGTLNNGNKKYTAKVHSRYIEATKTSLKKNMYTTIDLHLEYGLELEQTHYNSMIEIDIVIDKETNCLNCGHQSIVETIEHFILECTTYNSERQQFIELQQPYNENKDKVIGQFLFSKVNLENKKEGLFQMWKKRERQLKTLRRQ